MKFSTTISDRISPKVPVLLPSEGSAVRFAKDLGYDAVELHFSSADDIRRSGLLPELLTEQLHVSALATGRGYTEHGFSLIDGDERRRAQAVAFMKEFIVLAQEMNASVIVGCIRGNVDQHRDIHEQEALLAKSLKVLTNFAASHDVPLVIEAINRYENNYLNTLSEVKSFIERFHFDSMKILIDSFHMNIEEASIAQSILAAGDFIGYVHVADSNRRPPGEGHFHFESFFDSLKQIDYTGYVSAECLPFPTGEAAAEQWIDIMKTMEREDGKN